MFSRQTTGWVGFDIGATSVKAAQLVRTEDGCRLRAGAIVPRAQRWPLGSFAAAEPPSSADEISAAASLCEDLAGRSAASLLPVAACDLLQMDAPAAKRAGDHPDFLRAIEVETQRPMRDRVFDHWPMAAQAGKLNVVTAPRAWSDRISADVAASGWHCRVIDALPWALARAATLANASDTGRPVAALDWAYGKSTFCLVQKGVPLLVRSLKECGYQGVVDAVAANLRLDEHDAEALLQRYGLAPAGSSAEHVAAQSTAQNTPTAPRRSTSVIQDLLDPPLARLASELHRTLDYWRGVTRGQAPERIFLFGGGAALAGVGPRLGGHLGVPVEPWQLPVDNAAPEYMPPACLLGIAAGLSALAWEAK